MTNSTIIHKVALAHFKDKKVIMVRSAKNDEVFYMLGGKPEADETDLECLQREVKEEIDVEIVKDTLKFLHEFQGPAHGKDNTIVKLRLYSGEITGNPQPSNEIAEVQYFDTNVDRKHLGVLSIEMLSWLRARNDID